MPCLISGDPTPRQDVFGEAFSHDIVDIDRLETTLLYRWVIEDRWKLILSYDGLAGRSARYHSRDDMRPQLYDILSDPMETKNVATDHPDLLKRLSEKLQSWWPVTERKVQTEYIK
jgi:uncharacterized sulfatase